jgi:hypothetical protein
MNKSTSQHLHVQVSQQQQLLNPNILGGLDHIGGQAGEANPSLLDLLDHLFEAKDGPKLIIPLTVAISTTATTATIPISTAATARRELPIPTGPANISNLPALLLKHSRSGNRSDLLGGTSSLARLRHDDRCA